MNNVIYPLKGQERFATNLYVYLYYVKLLFFPFPLSVDYSFSQITPKTFANGWVIFSFLFFLFLVVLSFKKLSRRTIIAFGLLYYLSTFSIFSNFTESITIGSTIGERFMFLPSLGFCIVVVFGLYLLAKRISSIQFKAIILAIILPVAVIYSIKSFYRTKVWANNLTLYESGLKTAPKSWRIHNNLAEASFGRAEKIATNPSVLIMKADSVRYWYGFAKREFETAFDIIKEQGSVPYQSYMHYGKVLFGLKDTTGAMYVYRRATVLTSNLSAAWSNLATILYYENKFDSAIFYYQKALNANSPDLFSTYKNLGSSYLMIKDFGNAIKAYENALHYGTDKEIVSNLSFLYSTVGNLQKAGALAKSAGVSPDGKDQLKNMMNAGIGAYTRGDYAGAVKYLSQCESFYDQNAGYKRFPDFLKAWGESLVKLNEMDKAETVFNKLLKEDPRNYSALQNLGLIAYQAEKNYPKATEYFVRSLNSNSPDYYFVFTSLGFLYRIQNMPDKAIESFENSLRYGSSNVVINNLYQLWQIKGNKEKMKYYQGLLNK
ncbi:MAG: tetratricopeptide repeat protein [Flavisolibacter sp.]